MKIAVIGTGYVGLVTAAGLAEFGHEVIGADKVADKIRRISEGEVPIFEPGLDKLLQAGLKRGNLRFSHDLSQTIRQAESHPLDHRIDQSRAVGPVRHPKEYALCRRIVVWRSLA